MNEEIEKRGGGEEGGRGRWKKVYRAFVSPLNPDGSGGSGVDKGGGDGVYGEG